jgi:hypothetical protein
MQYLHPRSAAMDVWANRLRGSILSVTVGIAGLLGALVPGAGGAQQVTGTLGAPSATTTIRGNQLPPAPPAFGGVITQDARTSKPWWPPTVVPPKGAPNVLLIMTDDSGFGVPSTFGGVIPTPNLDRIAKSGLRYTQFHSTALCSPTRAALITGRNHHAVGFGQVSEFATGFPRLRLGHRDRDTRPLGASSPTMATRPPGSARTTTRRRSSTAPAGHSTSGQLAWAFQYFYGFMGGESDQWTPYLFRNTTPVFPWVGQKNYNLITDMADDAIRYMKDLDAATPDKPFLVYYVPGATHSPHHPTKEWIDKISAMKLFDQGWEKLRDTDLRQPEAPGRHSVEYAADAVAGQNCRSGTRCPRCRRRS